MHFKYTTWTEKSEPVFSKKKNKTAMYISEMLNLKARGLELCKKDYDDLVVHLCKKTISAVQLGEFLVLITSFFLQYFRIKLK